MAESMTEAIQRSPRVSGGGGWPARPPRSTTRRVAFQSLVTNCRPWRMRSSLNRTSCVEVIMSSPNRRASAPSRSTTSSGSIPVPRLLLMRRPSGACTTEWM